MRFLCISLLLVLLQACVTPTQNIKSEAKRLQLDERLIQGSPFVHQVFFHRLDRVMRSDRIHVYIEGDGTPWTASGNVSMDPTPRNPLTLYLMAQDPTPSIYLGRPCYFNLADSRGCDARYWTSRRYSKEVVNSMISALNNFLGFKHKKRLVLIGHSGGGTLAMLMAPRLKRVHAVITVAGNLDVDVWSHHHSYSPLVGSMNPAREAPLPRHIFQLHLVGDRDKVIPRELVEPEVRRQTNGRATVFENFTHVCCWERVWAKTLRRFGLSFAEKRQ